MNLVEIMSSVGSCPPRSAKSDPNNMPKSIDQIVGLRHHLVKLCFAIKKPLVFWANLLT